MCQLLASQAKGMQKEHEKLSGWLLGAYFSN